MVEHPIFIAKESALAEKVVEEAHILTSTESDISNG